MPTKEAVIPVTCPPDILRRLEKLKKATGQTSRAAAVRMAIMEACEKRGIK